MAAVASYELMDAGAADLAKRVISAIARSVEFAAALIIALAAIEATVKSVVLFLKRDNPPEEKVQLRLTFARWLAVALEFELAADILNTAVTPSWSDIEKLAAIATLRTALNYFLEREIQQESKPAQRHAEDATLSSKHSAVRANGGPPA